MAFHLHRLNLTGEPLRNALNGKARISTALSQARMDISISAITELAASLNIAADELMRDLTEDESREWAFYRQSASRNEDVWAAAERRWKAHGLSTREAARSMAIPHARILEALSGRHGNILDWQQARSLLDTIDPELPPEALLPQPEHLDR